jgi:hypothetical protein
MRFMVGYTVWNKVDHLVWLLEGIIENFSAADTDVAFHFDACTDQSDVAIDSLVLYWLHQRGGFKPEQFAKIVSNPEVREVGGHNKIIELGLEKGCDFIVVAQDDQRFNRPITGFLKELRERYGDDLGVITGRDAYTSHYGNFTGSFWSESILQRRIPHGEFVQLPYLNSGPVVYNPNLVRKVGLLDDQFRSHYVWDDYGARATHAGFKNGVLGMDITHAKFGRLTASRWGDPSPDIARLRMKHAGVL